MSVLNWEDVQVVELKVRYLVWLLLFCVWASGCWGQDITPGNLAVYPVYGDNETYGDDWDGDALAPSKNAIYDKIESMSSGGNFTCTGLNSCSVTALSDVSSAGSGSIITTVERSKLSGIENGATADQTGSEIVSLINAGTDLIDDDNIAASIARDSEVNAKISDEAYGSGWNGVTDIAPSKNVVYDKIESMGGGSGLWTDNDTGGYYYPNNWSDFKIFDSGKLDMAGSKWIYDDTPFSYWGIGCGEDFYTNQVVKNHSMNDTEHHQVVMRVEGISTGAKDGLALMTAQRITGSGQGWGLNPMIDITASWDPSSVKWAVGCEIDVNCNSSHVTPSDYGYVQGLMICGISDYAPTVAQTISMGTTDWRDGIWISDVSENGIVFLSNPAPHTGVRFDYPCSTATFWQNGGDMTFHDPNAGTKTLSELAAGGMSELKDDTTPELGGNLDGGIYDIGLDNAKGIYIRDVGGIYRIGLMLNSGNNWDIGQGAGGVVIGYDCSDPNPILIRVGGANNQQVTRSPDTDSQGRHYLVVP